MSGSNAFDDNRNSAGADSGLDAALERELEEALGDIGAGSFLEADRPAAPAAPAAAGVRRGTVIDIHKDDIFVDMGGKSQGVLPATQFEDQPLPKIGDIVEVTIAGYDRADGLLLLSRQGAVTAAMWQTLEEGQIVEGRVTGHNKGGLELDVNGIRAFMPISHVELFRVEDLAPYVNRRLKCQVIDVDEAERSITVSQRAVLELEAQEARERAFTSLIEGKIVTGTVKTIMPYGAFVDIGGVDGLLHIRDMSHSRVEKPEDIVKQGQKLEVKILKVDRDSRRVSLGLKQVMPDPWADAQVKWPIESIATGRVTKLMDFGAFVELEPGVEGLIPISEMTYERRIKHPSDVLKEGDVVKARVMTMDLERKRISLSLKRVGDDPWMGASARWPSNTVVEGVVKRLADFGAFVELTPGVEGLVHVSEISDERIRSAGDVLREGQTVKAKVLSVDEDARRISLSIKQLVMMPDYTGPETAPAEPEKPRPKRKKPLKGGLDW
jgi:small subunit ribosomal protein S1